MWRRANTATEIHHLANILCCLRVSLDTLMYYFGLRLHRCLGELVVAIRILLAHRDSAYPRRPKENEIDKL